jgi:outer membrane protein
LTVSEARVYNVVFVLLKVLSQGDVMKTSAKALALSAVVLLATVSAWAQGAPPPAAGAIPKIGIVDIRAAMLSTGEGKQAAAEIQSQFSAKQADLENMRKSLEDVQNRLRTGERTLSDEERIRLERQGQRMQQQLQRKQEEYQQDFNDAQQDTIDKLGRKMGEVISRYARENGYLMVMDAQVCNIYCSNQLDVTQDIIRLYDQAHPAKAAAAAPGTAKPATTPATQRPAQPTTTPPPAKPKP